MACACVAPCGTAAGASPPRKFTSTSDTRPSPNPAVASDLTMLVNFGDARERTLDEYRELLAASGLQLADAVALPSGLSILEARPAA